MADWAGPVRARVSVPRRSLKTIRPVAWPALPPTVVTLPEIAKKPELPKSAEPWIIYVFDVLPWVVVTVYRPWPNHEGPVIVGVGVGAGGVPTGAVALRLN